MINAKSLIIAACVASALGGGYYWLYADRDYTSCLLNHIGDARNEQAARLINRACNKKFSIDWDKLSTTPPQKPNYFDKYDNDENQNPNVFDQFDQK